MKTAIVLFGLLGLSASANASSICALSVLLHNSSGQTDFSSNYTCDGGTRADLYNNNTAFKQNLTKSIGFFLDQGYQIVDCHREDDSEMCLLVKY